MTGYEKDDYGVPDALGGLPVDVHKAEHEEEGIGIVARLRIKQDCKSLPPLAEGTAVCVWDPLAEDRDLDGLGIAH